jgi:hypothetical protein
MCKKGKTRFDNMKMFAFSTDILLMYVRTRNTMRNLKFLKGVQLIVLTPSPLHPIQNEHINFYGSQGSQHELGTE